MRFLLSISAALLFVSCEGSLTPRGDGAREVLQLYGREHALRLQREMELLEALQRVDAVEHAGMRMSRELLTCREEAREEFEAKLVELRENCDERLGYAISGAYCYCPSCD